MPYTPILQVESGTLPGLDLSAFDDPTPVPDFAALVVAEAFPGEELVTPEAHADAKALVQRLFYGTSREDRYAYDVAMTDWKAIDKRYRRQRAVVEAERVRIEREAKASAPLLRKAAAKRFTTDYGVEWGGKQIGADDRPWALIDRERFDPRTMRHHDLELGLDAIFDDGAGRVGIQAAGVGERAAHRKRFLDRGGVEKAERRRTKVIYLEFERGVKAPVKEEVWAQRP